MSDQRAGQLHGFLDLCLLSLLDESRDYGLGLGERLAEAGLGEIPGGTLYPALLRLEKHGFVAVEWVSSTNGPRRKYFALTPQGRAELTLRVSAWHDFRRAVDRVTLTAAEGVR